MKGSNFRKTITALAIALCFWSLLAQAADRETYHVKNLKVGDASVVVTAANGGLQNVATASTAAAVAEQGNFVIDDETVIATNNLFRINLATATVTNMGTIAATSSYRLVTPSDSLGGPQTNLVAEPGLGNAGAFLCIINAGPTNIVIADSATLLNTSGSTTLGADDTLTLYAVTTNKWIEVGQTDN